MARIPIPAVRTSAAIAAVLALAACGGGNDSAPPGASETAREAGTADVAQACSVFTLDVARQVLGESAKQSEISPPFTGSNPDIGGSTCTYEAEDPTPRSKFATVITATLTLNGARTATGRSSNQVNFESFSKELEGAGEKVESVSGVGDAAFYIGGVTNQLHVLVDGGRYAFIVSATDPNDDNRGATERLAKQIVDRL